VAKLIDRQNTVMPQAFAHCCRFGRSHRLSNVPSEYANDDSDQNHIDRDCQFCNQGKIGSDCDARKKGPIFHGEDADQLGDGFTAGNQGVRADKDPGQANG
jgi:hypothetical protein